jgi:hypothetical protein
MNEHVSGRSPQRVAGVAIVMLLSGIAAAPTAFANPSNAVVLVPPLDLPSLARQPGEAMFLDDTVDGRTLLYVEQNQGARLAIFDVTDPVHVKGEGSVQLDVPGPFDFLRSVGDQTELVRFREGRGDALLDLRNERKPKLQKIEGPQLQDSSGGVQPSRDYQVVETANSKGPARVVDVGQVREEMTNAGTGTTFLLTENGLYLVRRPALENVQPVYLNSGG